MSAAWNPQYAQSRGAAERTRTVNNQIALGGFSYEEPLLIATHLWASWQTKPLNGKAKPVARLATRHFLGHEQNEFPVPFVGLAQHPA
jgi:hypothetical protein